MEWLPEAIKSAGTALNNWFTRKDIYKRLDECDKERCEQREKLDENNLEIAALKYSVESYKELTLIGTLTCDERGKITDVSSEVSVMTGYSDNDLLRMHLRELLPYQLRDRHDEFLAELASGKREVRHTLVEAELRASIGNPVPVLVKIMRYYSGSGLRLRADIRRR